VHTLDLATLSWTLRPTGDPGHIPQDVLEVLSRGIPAIVPGCVHEDLLRASLIPDPRIGLNEPACAWVSRTDWIYSTTFEISELNLLGRCLSGPVSLYCCSLDTVASIHLNGTHLASTQSEFIPHRFDITNLLRPGSNTLSITFTSPLLHIEQEARRLGPRPVNGDWAPFNMIRKCASNFEWDWGPRLATVGIADDARIEFASPGRSTSPQEPIAALDADPTSGAFGFRTWNGSPITALGANWIPNGLFPADRTPEKVRMLLQAAKDCGMNMIRVWGGGRYEPDWFYEQCTELGLMVWQDFMFACACYPEEEPLKSLIIEEARSQVARLSRHPCIVLWCGGNENHWAHQSWGFKEKLAAAEQPHKTWGRAYWQSILPAIVQELDPSRPYWPDSPWSFDESTHPNDATRGDRHSWDMNFWDHWSCGYQKIIPRFCSEFGQQSPSNHATLRREAELLPAAPLTLTPPTDPSWSSLLMGPALSRRQRGPGGNQRWYDEPLDALFTRPTTFDQWHFAAQLLQARALRTAIEWHRVNAPACQGSLLWQLNDAWPGLSWSIIDSAGRFKPAYHAVKAAHAPRIASLHVVDDHLSLFAVNDTDEPWEETATLQLMSFTGDTIRRWPCTLHVPPRTSLRVGRLGKPSEITSDPTRQFISFRSAHATAEWFFRPDKELNYPVPEFRKVRVTPTTNGVRLYFRAHTLIRDLIILADRLDPNDRIGCAHITLLPTERFSIEINAPTLIHDLKSSGLADDDDAPLRWPFLQCASTLGKRD
jgi:beta-galactosidase/beta-glucuronidase